MILTTTDVTEETEISTYFGIVTAEFVYDIGVVEDCFSAVCIKVF